MEMFRDKDKKRDFKIMILFFIMWLITFLALAFMVYKYIELNTGRDMPRLGLGLGKAHGDPKGKDQRAHVR